MLHRLLSFARTLKHRWRQRPARIHRELTSPAALAFWKDHGREWALGDASHEDLSLVGGLADRIVALPGRQKEAEVASAFREIWQAGFFSSAEALPWDSMSDKLPASALVAFVEGAGLVWKEKRSTS